MDTNANCEAPPAILHPPSSILNEFTASFPDPYQILGLSLRPLSLGRYRLLHRFKCAFVSETETKAEIGDLLLGVAICALRVDEFLADFESGRFFRDLRRWAKRISASPPWYLRWPGLRWLSRTGVGRAWRRNHSFNFVEKMQLFQNYIQAAQQLPEYSLTQENDRRSTQHWSSSVEGVLRSELNWSEEEINEAPLTKALADYFAQLERQGLVTIFTPEDIRIGEENARILQELESKIKNQKTEMGEGVANGS